MPYAKIRDLCAKIADEPSTEKLIPLLKQLREDLAKIRKSAPEEAVVEKK
ncbi:MAG: hypothetical protein WBV36_10980 [Terriglobales bacterium]|jgi:hypothetical protein